MNSDFKKIIKNIFPYLSQKFIIYKINKKFSKVKDVKKETCIRYFKNFSCELNLEKPKTFYDKVNYLKVNQDLSSFSNYVDKYAAKTIAKNIDPMVKISPIISFYLSYSEFKRAFLKKTITDPCVIKLNHTSGDVFFLKNGVFFEKHGNKISKRDVFGILRAKMKFDYYKENFETCYKNIEKKIIVEEYIPSLAGLDEYKIFCNNGEPKMVNVVYGRQSNNKVREVFTDIDLNILPTNQGMLPIDKNELYVPKCWNKMITFAKKASKDFTMLRVDMLTDGDIFYFCEFTFYDFGGNSIFYPAEMNEKIGNMFNI